MLTSLGSRAVPSGLVVSYRAAPMRIASITPKQIDKLVMIPNVPIMLAGTVSSTILGPATVKMPVANPKKNLPMSMAHRFSTALMITATHITTLKMSKHFLRPILIRLPPNMAPQAEPKIPIAVMQVFWKLEVQPKRSIRRGLI